MKLRTLLIALALMLLVALMATPISDVRAQDETPPEPTSVSIEDINVTTGDGDSIFAQVINGPSEPPDIAEFEAFRVSKSELDRAVTALPNFPSYSWVFGCSAVSGAMIAAYYDNYGYDKMYTGPTNGGVMPITEDPAWGSWSDGDDTYPNNPLIASHEGVDEYVGFGSIDDYWVSYFSSANDPYITGSWPQHDWGTAIGDFMKTSQSVYGPRDGETYFYNYSNSPDRLTCVTMNNSNFPDGTLGRKLFYEDKGYAVTDCYNQRSDNSVSGGFSFDNFKAEIDAGQPVMLNLRNPSTGEGHTVVGYGYGSDGNRIYIRTTWDSDPDIHYYMNWDGTFQNMIIVSVSIVHLAEPTYDFSKSNPSNNASGLNPEAVTLNWEESLGAQYYEYCLNTVETCTNWIDVGTNRSVFVSPLADAETYYWQVRAVGSTATTYANGSEGASWSFTTFDSALMTEKGFLPVMTR